MILMIMIITSLIFGACDKSGSYPTASTFSNQDDIYEMIWATRMDYEKEIVGTDNTQHYKDWVLVGGDMGHPPTILAFDKNTGEKDWEYIHDGDVQDEIDISFVFNNIYVGMCSGGIVGIDLNTKSSIWEIDLRAMGMTSGINFEKFGQHLYFHPVWGLGSPDQNVKLIKLDPMTGKVEVAYQTSNGLISPPVFLSDHGSNTTIVFNEYPWENDLPEKSTQNLVCLNLNTNQEIWRKDSISQFFASNVGQNPVIYDNRIVITGGDWSIYAFELETGKKLWSHQFDYPWAIWTKTNHIIHGNRLYVNNGQEDVTCLNPETGELIWNNPKGGPNCTDNMVYYEKEDLLVFTSWGYGSIMILDALTGKTLHREYRYDNSQYNNDVVYDKERDMFFTSTYKHAIGFKVSRPK